MVLKAGEEVCRVVGASENHVLVVQLSEPNTLALTVRMPPPSSAVAPSSSSYPSPHETLPPFSVHFPLPGVPFFLPSLAHYKICNLAMDDPIFVPAPPTTATAAAASDPIAAAAPAAATSTAASATAASESGEQKEESKSVYISACSPGSIAVVEIWTEACVAAAAPAAEAPPTVGLTCAEFWQQAQKALTLTACEAHLQGLQDRALQLRMQQQEDQAALLMSDDNESDDDRDRDHDDQEGSDAANDGAAAESSDEDFEAKYAPPSGNNGGARSKRKRLHRGSAAASSKRPRRVPASLLTDSAELQLADRQIAELQAYIQAVQAQGKQQPQPEPAASSS